MPKGVYKRTEKHYGSNHPRWVEPIELICSWCKKRFKRKRAIVNTKLNRNPKTKFYCSKECQLHMANFKGGHIDGRGYRRIRREYEHRVVMEKYLKRRLETREHVHHINGNRADNKIENLLLMDIKEHGSLEGKKARGIPKKRRNYVQ